MINLINHQFQTADKEAFKIAIYPQSIAKFADEHGFNRSSFSQWLNGLPIRIHEDEYLKAVNDKMRAK